MMTDLMVSRFLSGEQTGALEALHEYWQMKGGHTGLPARSDLDPADFRYALGNVSLLNVLTDPLRFRFRLVASNVQARFALPLTGTFMSEFPEHENGRLFEAVYRTVCKTRSPQTYAATVIEGAEPRLFRARIWPLSSDRRNIDMLICCREPVAEGSHIRPDTADAWLARDA